MLKTFLALLLAGCASTPKLPSEIKITRQNTQCIQNPVLPPKKLAYFKALLAKKDSTLDEFLVTWFDRPETPAGEAYFTKCEPVPYEPLVPNKERYLPEDCAPDVLYAWGPLEKLAELTKAMESGDKWTGAPMPHSEPITASLSPATSFTSGLYQVRIRLKKGVPIYAPQTEKEAKAAEGVRPVVYASRDDQKLSVGDFKIYDADAISGWSYGTPEQYDETVREIKWILKGHRALGFRQVQPFARVGWPSFFALTVPQMVDPTEENLLFALKEMAKQIVTGKGDMAFNDDYCPQRAAYFRARKPTYVAP